MSWQWVVSNRQSAVGSGQSAVGSRKYEIWNLNSKTNEPETFKKTSN
jgi:hypothetical protein